MKNAITSRILSLWNARSNRVFHFLFTRWGGIMSLNESKRLVCAIFVVCMAVFVSYTAVASLSRSQSINSYGNIVAVNLGVYQDSACTVNATSIDWGVVDPGSSVTRSLYVKNTGNVAVRLSLAVPSWSPSIAGSYLAVVWDRQGAVLSAGQVVQATFTLTVSATATGFTDFSNVLV